MNADSAMCNTQQRRSPQGEGEAASHDLFERAGKSQLAVLFNVAAPETGALREQGTRLDY